MHQIILFPTTDGGYSAEVPSLPGCTSYGETAEEALASIHELIKYYVERAEEETQEIPKPGRAARV
jgi:antitoxin HicB